MFSPMAWTRSRGSDPQWWGSGINVWPADGGPAPVGSSVSTTPTAETISRGKDGGKGSAVRLACFFRIFRVASLLA